MTPAAANVPNIHHKSNVLVFQTAQAERTTMMNPMASPMNLVEDREREVFFMQIDVVNERRK